MNLLDIGKNLLGNFQQSASRNPIISAIQGGLQQTELARIASNREGYAPKQQRLTQAQNYFNQRQGPIISAPTNYFLGAAKNVIGGLETASQGRQFTGPKRFVNPILGALEIGYGVGQATPMGAGLKLGETGLATMLQSARQTRGGPAFGGTRNLASNFSRGLGERWMGVGSTGLGIQGLPGIAVDILAQPSNITSLGNKILQPKSIGKGMTMGRNTRSTWAPDELGMLDQINEFLRKNKTLENWQATKLDDRLTYLAKSHVPVKTIEKLANEYGQNEVGFMRALTKVLMDDSMRSKAASNYSWDLGMGIAEKGKPKPQSTVGGVDPRQFKTADEFVGAYENKVKSEYSNKFNEAQTRLKDVPKVIQKNLTEKSAEIYKKIHKGVEVVDAGGGRFNIVEGTRKQTFLGMTPSERELFYKNNPDLFKNKILTYEPGENGGIYSNSPNVNKAQLTEIWNKANLPQPPQPQSTVGVKAPSAISKQSPQKVTEQSKIPLVSKAGKAAIKEAESMGDRVLLGGSSKPPGNLVTKSSKYAYNINKNRLQLNPSEKKTLDTVVNTITPELEKAKGKTLSNKEVIEAAKKSEILTKVTTRDETLQANAAMLKARQKLVELDKDITAGRGNVPAKMKELIDSLRVVSSEAADRGRKLQSLAIGAEDESVRTTLLKEISKVETDTDRIVKEAANVNWDNANDVAKFYRKFIKPTTTEILDEYRYNNMLSNPRTHIRNAFSNLVQTFYTRPATKLLSGDIGGAGKYYAGTVKSLPKATKAFINSFSGSKAVAKPDLEHIPTLKLPKFMTIPTRAMEAGDAFFSTLIREGELASGMKPELVDDIASYSLFRGGLSPKGQGNLLNAIDSATEGVYQMGNKIPALRWFVPFVRTPMNFAKQWIEYSPAGLATLPGSTNKKEQLAKTLLGSGVALMGAQLALNDDTTWSAPTNKKQKDMFYASGKKPFSIRIGDKWVSMMYAGPFAMALALPAAVKYYQEESRTALTDTQMQKLGKITSSMAEFLSGQTFMEGLGNFVGLLKGDADYTVGKNLAYTAQQLIPFQGLVKYITQIIDPIYRQAKTPAEQIKSNLPFISKELPAYTYPSGEPEVRQRYNLVTPYDITPQNLEYEGQLNQMIKESQQTNLLNKMKEEYEAAGKTSLSVNGQSYNLKNGKWYKQTESKTEAAPKTTKKKAKAAKKVTIKKLATTKLKLKKYKRLKMAKLPKPKITKTKGYRILTYTDKTPTVKIAKPTMKWS